MSDFNFPTYKTPPRAQIALRVDQSLYDELNSIAETEDTSIRGVVMAFIEAALPEYYKDKE